MSANELISIVQWTVSHKFRGWTRAVQSKHHLENGDIYSEIMAVVLKESKNPKWKNSPPCNACTAITNCAYFTLLEISRSKKHELLGQGIDRADSVGSIYDLAKPQRKITPQSEDLFLQVSGMLPPRLTRIIMARHGDPGNVITLTKLGKEMGITHERVRQLEKQAMEILRKPENRMAIMGE